MLLSTLSHGQVSGNGTMGREVPVIEEVKNMPLYKKALNFKPNHLVDMTFDECYELLLAFRYLHFRNDSTISREVMESHMEAIRKRMLELNKDAAQFPGYS